MQKGCYSYKSPDCDLMQYKKMEHKTDPSPACFKRQHLKSRCCLGSLFCPAWKGRTGPGRGLAEELWLFPRLPSATEAGWLNKLQERAFKNVGPESCEAGSPFVFPLGSTLLICPYVCSCCPGVLLGHQTRGEKDI